MVTDRHALVIAKCEAFTAWLDSPPLDHTAKARYYTALARLRQYDADHPQDRDPHTREVPA